MTSTPDDFAIGKITKIFDRPNGSQVKLVVSRDLGANNEAQDDMYALKRASETGQWDYVERRPAEGWKQMSRADYLKHGRSELLKVLTVGEILGTIILLSSPQEILNGKRNLK